jgi:hypothetical protein
LAQARTAPRLTECSPPSSTGNLCAARMLLVVACTQLIIALDEAVAFSSGNGSV